MPQQPIVKPSKPSSTMNNFSFSRFVTYSKSELVSNRRMLLMLLGSAFAFFMIVFYFNHLAQSSNHKLTPNKFYSFDFPCILSWFSIMIFCGVYISTSFKKYFQKGYASASLMLPVAQSEKFTFALLFNSLIVPSVLISLACVISYGWALYCDMPWSFIAAIKPGFYFNRIILACAYLSIFFFGSIFFRRNQFLYTMLSLFVIGAVLVYLGYLLGLLMMWWQPDTTWMNDFCTKMFGDWSSDEIFNLFQTIGKVVGTLFILFMWRLSWRHFRKLQITK